MATEAKWSDFASMDGAKMIAAANQLLPPWVTLALVVVIAWQLARMIWMLVPGPAAGDPVTAAVGVPAMSAPSAAGADAHPQIALLLQRFDAAQPIEPDTENLEDTRLTNLSLKGTVTATPAERAVAIIADASNEEEVYAIGDAVTSGAKLHAVYSDRVVLNENGVLTNLKLPRDFPEVTPTSARRDSTITNRATTSTQSIQAVVAQNVSKLADVIRPTPYFVNGQQQGYRVYPGRNRAQFSQLGLRPGDLIREIDGQALTDPNQAMQIFETLNNADQVSVTVERNGQPEVIVLSTSQLDLEDETSQ